MEAFAFFFVILIILALFFLIFGTVGMGIYALFIAPVVEVVQIRKGITPSQREILKKCFAFYQNLNFFDKKEFERRLKYFLMHKQFIPKNMEEITEEMQVLVGACAVQITFGYQPLKLTRFKKIILYPTEYYSNFSKRKHKGEVNPRGMIVLSWEDFIKGYKIPDDGYNLGLHEMAHALKMEDAIHDDEYAFFDEDYLKEWHRISNVEFKKIRRGEPSFLRSYAGSDKEEFFAVCVEYFFEKPVEFREQLPELYLALANLLNQDPASGY